MGSRIPAGYSDQPNGASCLHSPAAPKDHLGDATVLRGKRPAHLTPGRIREATCTATLGSPLMLAMASSRLSPEAEVLAEGSGGQIKTFLGRESYPGHAQEEPPGKRGLVAVPPMLS